MTLVFQRQLAGAEDPAGPKLHLLGERQLRAGGRPLALPPQLDAQQDAVERWLTDAPPQEGRTGSVVHRFDGHWLWGEVMIPMPTSGAALKSLVRESYRDVFRTLGEHGGLQLLRLWNYIPRINDDLNGLEVYRHFNIGRQQAFMDAGASTLDGSPAACALGQHGDAVSISFLAGRVTPRTVENPRQVSAYRYPGQYGPSSPTFSRAALVQTSHDTDMLFISGTASIVGHATVHAGDVVRQTEETLRNLRAVIDAAHAHTPHRFDLSQMEHTINLRHPSDLPAVRQVFNAAVGASSPAARTALWLHADVCRSDLLVEIEVQGLGLRRD